jgi:hypothetical protein
MTSDDDNQWQKSQLSAEYEGELKTFDFWWREPMDYCTELITDPSMMEHTTFYPVEKTLHQDGRETRMYDEPWTGTTWAEVQVHQT